MGEKSSRGAASGATRWRWSVLAVLLAVATAAGFLPALTPVAAAATSSVEVSSPRTIEGNLDNEPVFFTITGTCGDPAGCTVSGNTQTGTPGPTTATAGEDFADQVYSYPVSGTFSQTVGVSVIGDRKVEQDEQFQLNASLSDSAGVRVGLDQGTATIVNDDTAPVFTVASSSPRVTEGNSGTRPATFTISGTCGDPAGCTISGNTQTGTPGPTTATAGEDFADTVYSYQVSGNFSQDVTVNVNGDTKVEQDEQFQLNVSLNDSAGTRVGLEQGTATIVNDDSAAPPDPRADVVATLTVPATATAGSSFPVTLTVTNRGPGTATQVKSAIDASGMRITSAPGAAAPPSGPFAAFVQPSLAPGASATYRVTVTTDRSARGPRDVIAATKSSATDPNVTNNAALRRVTVTAPR